jgi:hypothetical protein
MQIDAGPALALVAPVGVSPEAVVSHPFSHPHRKQVIRGIKNAMATVVIVPVMAATGGIIGAIFFAIVIGILDHFYFHSEFSRPYLETLAHKSLLVGVFAGIPVGAYGSVAATGAFIRNAGKVITGFCILLALPFLLFPPYHFYPHVVRIGSLYHLPPGIFGIILLALPFLAFAKFYHTMFITALASRR